MLSFHNITHKVEERTLFSEVGFSLQEGSLLVIKGPNGCGKTTLLKILSGIIKPSYGFIFFQENEINENYENYLDNIEFLGHRNAIDGEFTVRENLEFWASISHKPQALEVVIKYLSLEKYLDTKVKKLSQGWQRRIALSRLMINRRKIWLLDEPFTNLDEEAINITLSCIATFCDQGGVVVLTSHQDINYPFGMELRLDDFAPSTVI
jgi:heme exporter protein A